MQLMPDHLTTFPLHQPDSSSASITGVLQLLAFCSGTSTRPSHLMLVIRAFFPAGTLLAKSLNHGQLAKASKNTQKSEPIRIQIEAKSTFQSESKSDLTSTQNPVQPGHFARPKWARLARPKWARLVRPL